MFVRKYVLLVDSADGELTHMAAELKSMGYDVVRASDLTTAIRNITHLRRLSLVAVNCATREDEHDHFMAVVRSLHPALPVIWLTSAHSSLARFLKQPASVSDPTSGADEIHAEASKLLHEEFYSSAVVEEVVTNTSALLAELGMPVKPSAPYIKSNLTFLSDINAIISFGGEGLSGHLMLSATQDKTRQAHKAFAPNGPEPQVDDLEDFLGELSNQILGRIKRVFEARSLAFQLRVPSFIRGPQARYRKKSVTPSLAVEFQDENGQLRLEFSLDRLDVDTMVVAPDVSFMESGDLHFL